MWERAIRPAVLAAILALPALTGCAADPGIPEDVRAVHGIWRWDHSSGGIAGIRMDPGTEGIDYVFRFRRDGTLEIYSAGRLVVSPTLEITTADPVDGVPAAWLRYAKPFPLFPFDLGITRHLAVRTAPDTLVLADPCCNRYRHTLVRVE